MSLHCPTWSCGCSALGRTCGAGNLLSRSFPQMTKTAHRNLVQDSRNPPIVCQVGSGFPRLIVALHPSIQAPSLESPLERTTAKCLRVEAFNNPKVMFVVHATQLVQPQCSKYWFQATQHTARSCALLLVCGVLQQNDEWFMVLTSCK